MNVWYGWIVADLEDRDHLESLGVRVGDYDFKSGSFNNCEVSDECMTALDPYWHRYYWLLELLI